jgi:hypothetical protein
MAFVLWKDIDALHKAHHEGICLGIVTKKFETSISWVAFAEKTNTNQRSKFFKWLKKMELQKKEMKRFKSVHGKWESHLEGDFTTKATKYEIVKTLRANK